MKLLAALATALLLLPVAIAEQTTKPIRYTWIATSCETWNCAVAALVLADGDPHVLVLPTAHEKRPWLVLKRVEQGAIAVPDEEPFTCSVYDTVLDASMVFAQTDACRFPLIVSVPDGRMIVAMLQTCAAKQRGVR